MLFCVRMLVIDLCWGVPTPGRALLGGVKFRIPASTNNRPPQEFTRCVAAQLRPGDEEQIDFNADFCEYPLLPSMTPQMRRQMTMTTS